MHEIMVRLGELCHVRCQADRVLDQAIRAILTLYSVVGWQYLALREVTPALEGPQFLACNAAVL